MRGAARYVHHSRAGYTVPEGRGSRFIDGLTLTNGATVQAVFHLYKTS